jgi:2'-5' RNA ligase
MSRIFVAITISPALQSQILQWQEQYSNLPVRWLSGKNLHVTLIPPWETKDKEQVIRQLSEVNLPGTPLTIHFDKVSYGPNLKEPRLIWSVGQPPKGLLDLKRNIEHSLRITPSTRTFKLHATLARFRPDKFKGFSIPEINDEVSWEQKIDAFVLMESHLSSQGADYTILKTFK